MSPAPDHAVRFPTVSVVILALDEAGNIPLVLDNLPPLVSEVIVVDGGSADDTVAVARQAYPRAQVVRQTRSGKGNALACGFALCRGDIVVTLNGDGSTDPGEIPRFVDALMAGAEAAHGSRFRIGGEDMAATRLERLGNRMLSHLVNRSFETRFTDVGSSYNAFWRARLETLGLPEPSLAGDRPEWGEGAEIEPLVNVRMAAEGLRVVEVATTRYPPIHGRRRRRRLARAIRALRVLVRERRRRSGLTRRPPAPARHAAREEVTDGRPYPGRPYPGPRPDWAGSVDRRSVRRSGVYESGAHRADSGVRQSALYDTGVRRTGVYDTGVHRTEIYDTGAEEPAREVGGGRRRLDAKDRRAVPGERSTR